MIRLQNPAAQVAVHPRRLEGPAGALLVVEGPEDGQWEEEPADGQNPFRIFDELLVVNVAGVVEPVVVLLALGCYLP